MGSMVPLQGSETLLADNPRIRFVLIGEGQQSPLIEEFLRTHPHVRLCRRLLSAPELVTEIGCAEAARTLHEQELSGAAQAQGLMALLSADIQDTPAPQSGRRLVFADSLAVPGQAGYCHTCVTILTYAEPTCSQPSSTRPDSISHCACSPCAARTISGN